MVGLSLLFSDLRHSIRNDLFFCVINPQIGNNLLKNVKYKFKASNGFNTACLWLVAGVVNDAVHVCKQTQTGADQQVKIDTCIVKNNDNDYFS